MSGAGNGLFGGAALAFDLDGTLIHSAPDLHAAANRMLGVLERAPLTLEQVTSFVGNGVPKLVERCLIASGDCDETLHASALETFNDFYGAAPADLTRPFPGAVETLQALKAAGVPLGICTNKPQRFTEQVLDLLDLRGYFGAVVGGDRLPVKKPDAAPLRLCFEELGVDPMAGVFVGDSEADEATAQALGVPFVFFTGGYRKKGVEEFQSVWRFDGFSELLTKATAA